VEIMTQYTAFLISEKTRGFLTARFPPLYPDIEADHITHEFGIADFGSLFHPKSVRLTSIADDLNGIQAFIAEVDGTKQRPDGDTYHLTWSLDSKKQISRRWLSGGLSGQFGAANKRTHYRAIHSSHMIKDLQIGNGRQQVFGAPIDIEVMPAHITHHPGQPGRDIAFLP